MKVIKGLNIQAMDQENHIEENLIKEEIEGLKIIAEIDHHHIQNMDQKKPIEERKVHIQRPKDHKNMDQEDLFQKDQEKFSIKDHLKSIEDQIKKEELIKRLLSFHSQKD